MHEEQSEFNRILVLEQPGGVRELKFESPGAPSQSVVRMGQPRQLELAYTRGSVAGLAYVPSPERILVIGVGGGSLPMFLRETTQATIDAVDIDPAVIRVARDWFGFREDARLRTHAEDGRAFIQNSPPSSYDLIILDAYDADAVPSALWTEEFLEAVHRRLRPGGVLVANVWRRPNPRYGQMLGTFHRAFPTFDRVVLEDSGNELFVGIAAPTAPAKASLLEQARRVRENRGIPFDLPKLLRRGLIRPGIERTDT